MPQTTYGQYCPISRAVEVLGERWSVLIVRDMLCGATRFNDIARGLPGISRSLLAKRLRQLERAGIVERLDGAYELTEAGEDLRSVVFGLGEWGARWQFGEPRDDELDPELLMWWMHDRLDFSVFPERRIVLEFDFPNQRRRIWIVNEAAGPSVCTVDPGFEVDVLVRADLVCLYEVWLGRRELRAALRDGSIELLGQPALVRRFPKLLLLSPVAELAAATAPAQTAGHRRRAGTAAAATAD
jgi:DNA-binding HxlR family transcriptional regulator